MSSRDLEWGGSEQQEQEQQLQQQEKHDFNAKLRLSNKTKAMVLNLADKYQFSSKLKKN